ESTLTTPSAISWASAASTASSVAPFPRNDFSDRHSDAGFVGRLSPIFRRLSASRLIVAAGPGTEDTGFATAGPGETAATAGAAPTLAAAFLAGGVGTLADVAVFFAAAFFRVGAAAVFCAAAFL